MQRIASAAASNPSLVPLNQQLETLVTDITFNLSPGLAEEALKQLVGESLVNVNTAVASTVMKTQSVVFNRLDRVREIESGNLTPPAAGSGSELNRVWVGGFGIWSREDDSSTVSGYTYSGGGVALGYDRKFEGLSGLRLGVSGAFSGGRIDNNDDRTTVDLATAGFGVYGSYVLPNNVFFDANVGYARTRNEYTTNLILGGNKTGEFDINSWQFGLRGGVIIKGERWQLIPSVGVKYTILEQDDFTDRLDAPARAAGYVANHYRSRTDHQVDIPVQVKFNATVQAGSATVTPEFRLGYNFAVKKLDNEMRVGFVGSDDTARIIGTRARGNSFQAGVGLKINTGGVLDAFVNYDLDAAHRYVSHNASIGIGFEF
jgi:outer membrane autotransporter protein